MAGDWAVPFPEDGEEGDDEDGHDEGGFGLGVDQQPDCERGGDCEGDGPAGIVAVFDALDGDADANGHEEDDEAGEGIGGGVEAH